MPWDYKIINHWKFIIFSDRRLTFKTTLMGLKQASLSVQARCQFHQSAGNWGLKNCQIPAAAYGCMAQLSLLFGFNSNLLGVPTPKWIFGWLYLLGNRRYTCDRHPETILLTFTTWLWPQGSPPVTMTSLRLSDKQRGGAAAEETEWLLAKVATCALFLCWNETKRN